jgi:alpha-L-fucosidase 2
MMEALPIGNGRMGAMFFGGVNAERLQFNEDSLWPGYPGGITIPPDGRAWMDEVQTLLAKGDVIQANAVEGQRPPDKVGSMDSFGAYQPFGDILIEFVGHDAAEPQAYRRSLDLARALGQVQYVLGTATYRREYFASHPDQVVVARLSADGEVKLDLNIKLTSPHGQVKVGVEGSNTMVFSGTMPASGQKFAARLLVRATGGTAMADAASGSIQVRDAGEVELLLAAHTDYAMDWPATRRNVDPAELCRATIDKASKKTYEELWRAHVADHQALFARVALELPAPAERRSLPTDQRLIAYNTDYNDPGLEKLLFEMGRYLMIASSRPGALPANLQGVWNDMKDPAWMCDYHTDINIQMNYWVNGPTGLPECFEPFTRYVAFLRSAGRSAAKEWFGADGFFVHIYTNPWGYSGLRWLWTGAAGWLCQNLYDHYLFTGDRTFLEEQAYPIMKDASAFYEDVLREYHKGGLVVTPSLSPENHFNHPGADEQRMCAGSAIDQQIVYELFGHTAEAARILGKDEDLAVRLLDLRDKLSPPVKIAANGAVQEWIEDWPATDPQHRHLSHLYALYPGNQIDPLTTPAWATAARKAIDIRSRRVGSGWGVAWQIALLARLHDGDGAHGVFRHLLKRCRQTGVSYSDGGGTYDNLLTGHSPYQIDASFGYTAAVAEMLLQSQRGNWRDGFEIHLLPALPAAWPDGNVTGLCARGGFVVDIEWKDGRLTQALIHSLTGQPCRVRYGEKTIEIEIAKGISKVYHVKDFAE